MVVVPRLYNRDEAIALLVLGAEGLPHDDAISNDLLAVTYAAAFSDYLRDNVLTLYSPTRLLVEACKHARASSNTFAPDPEREELHTIESVVLLTLATRTQQVAADVALYVGQAMRERII